VKTALLVGLLLATIGCHPQEKHTGPAQLIYISEGRTQFWFVRPNHELFEMCFDNPPPQWFLNNRFVDITYFDDNADKRHFIKARLEGK
jgi:hypothetical protein